MKDKTYKYCVGYYYMHIMEVLEGLFQEMMFMVSLGEGIIIETRQRI